MKLKSNEYYVIKKKICRTTSTRCKYCRNGTIIKLVNRVFVDKYRFGFKFILDNKNKKLEDRCGLFEHEIKHIKSLTKKDKTRLVLYELL